MPATVIRFDPMRSVAFGSITGSYVALGTAFTHKMRILHLINNTNGDVFISFNAVDNNIFVPAGSFVLYDVETNTQATSEFSFSLNTQIYLKYSSSPSAGSFYAIAAYGQGE